MRFGARVSRTALATWLLWTTATPCQVLARDFAPDAAEEGQAAPVASKAAEVLRDTEMRPLDELLPLPQGVANDEGASATADAAPDGEHTAPPALPERSPKSKSASNGVRLPQGQAGIEGLGASFKTELGLGLGSYGIPIELPPPRGGVGPSLRLSYSSSGGQGVAGLGWSVVGSSIGRSSLRGSPRYLDEARWHPQEDRFAYDGRDLVPVDSHAAEQADCGGACAPIPVELRGWQQYRAEIEGTFMRFFRAPDSARWVVQEPSGVRHDFGVLLKGEGPDEAVDASLAAVERPDAGELSRIYRWSLVRSSDAHGNAVYYVHDLDGGRTYLRDIYYVSPHALCGQLSSAALRRSCSAPFSSWAHRVRFVYQARPDVHTSYASGFALTLARRIGRIEITSNLGEAGDTRTLVRRYHLSYVRDSFHSLLEQVQVEGRPSILDARSGAQIGVTSIAEAELGPELVGDTLPATRFTYSEQPDDSAPIPGFGGLGGTVHRAVESPQVSIGDPRVSLFDVNSDGLPDVLHTDAARYRSEDDRPALGAAFNGFTGVETRPGSAGSFSAFVPVALPSGLAEVMTLTNLNLAAMDVDGDGRAEFVHMPDAGNYGYFVLGRLGDAAGAYLPGQQGWAAAYVERALPRGALQPRIDLGRDGERVRILDLDGDGLIDVARSTGTELQAFFNLGWLEGGDGRFGSYSFDRSLGRFELSSEPVRTCLLHGGTSVDFADSQTHVADMNGDGLPDILRLSRGQASYWPGLGAAGFGSADSCRSGGSDGRVRMDNPPAELDIDAHHVRITDVNQDGTPDVLQLGYDEISVWFNLAGRAFSERTVLSGTPRTPAVGANVAIDDIDGSGTVDVVWGDAGNYRWIDLMDGRRPRLLLSAENGFGGESRLTYGTSVDDYLRDLREADACRDVTCERFTWNPVSRGCDAAVRGATNLCLHRATGSPVVTSVVRELAVTDHLDVLGHEAARLLTRYRYHDAYYEGCDQAFRGFGAADEEKVGDSDASAQLTRTRFHQGRRPDESAANRRANNPNAALQGSAALVETRDGAGQYVSSLYSTFTVRRLLRGLDGRDISAAFLSQTDTLRYDHSPYRANPGAVVRLPVLVYEDRTGLGGLPENTTVEARVRGLVYAHTRTRVGEMDAVGHPRMEIAHGRVRGEFGEEPDERIVEHHEFTNLPDSESGWLWRRTRTSMSDGSSPQRYGDTRSSFDAEGNEVRNETAVEQVERPDFPGLGDAQGFGSPSPRSIVQTKLHGPWGEELTSCAGEDAAHGTDCMRYRRTSFEAAYALTPAHEETAVRRAGAGFAFLETRAAFDRGLGVVVSSETVNGARADFLHDGLGRPTGAVAPPTPACPERVPSALVRYDLTDDAERRPLSRIITTDWLDCDGREKLQQVQYIDGLGRARATLVTADRRPGRWVQSGVVRYDRRGRPIHIHEPAFFTENSGDMAAALIPNSTDAKRFVYDAFDRIRGVYEVNGDATWTSYHALSSDVCDPLDLDDESEHVGTCATTRVDGHERVIDVIARNRQPGVTDIETYRVWSTYRADGALLKLERAQTLDDRALPGARDVVVDEHRVERRFSVDSLGRMVATTDPDSDNRATGATWRYLHNVAGDLVAVRDPRGCGQNFYYDLSGRLLGEQYVGCAEALVEHANTVDHVPAGSVGLGVLADAQPVSVRNYYDSYEGTWATDVAAFEDFPVAEAASPVGMLVGAADRGQRSVYAYDLRGNALWSARQMALPAAASLLADTLAAPAPPTSAAASSAATAYDEAHTYVRSASYDAADRASGLVLPRDPDFEDGEPGPRVGGRLEYGADGLPFAAFSMIVEGGGTPTRANGSLDFGPDSTVDVHRIVASMVYDAAGGLLRTVYGDRRPGREPTESTTQYDARHRPEYLRTSRVPTELPSPERPLGAVSVVVDQKLIWDAASNLVELEDRRLPGEWPAGHRPQWLRMKHDSLYRVVDVAYRYRSDSGALTAHDEATDYRTELERTRDADPMRAQPAPRMGSLPAGRVASLTWQYDWLGNGNEWTDDAHSFYERSLDVIRNGADYGAGLGSEPSLRPSAMYLAHDLADGDLLDRGGYLELDYGASGNVAAMTVHTQCGDRGELTCQAPAQAGPTAQRAALAAACVCNQEQHYQYLWDELNRLAEARRFDRWGGEGPWVLAARQRYRYDGENTRTLKHTLAVGSSEERAALHVYPGDFERRGLRVGADAYLGDPEDGTETQYLVGSARIVWQHGEQGLGLDPRHRITVPLTDLLGTTGAVLDLTSGELVEHSTYYPNGARETFLAREEADVAPEPAGFTGKEADEEVGLTYFGERYLISRIGRWASPDPLQIHAAEGGEALNGYHYVAGSLLQTRDPLGLEGTRGATVDLSQSHPDNKLLAEYTEENPQDNPRPEWTRVWMHRDGLRFETALEAKYFRNVGQWLIRQGGDHYSYLGDSKYQALTPEQAAKYAEQWGRAAAMDPQRYRDMCRAFDLHLGAVTAIGNTLMTGMSLAPGGALISASQAVATCADGSAGDCAVAAAGTALDVVGRLGKLRAAHADGGVKPTSLPCARCFAAGTLVHTADGERPIEDIRAGDSVWARDPESGQLALREVVATTVLEDRATLELGLVAADGSFEFLEVTEEHPFWVEGEGWIGVEDLLPGTALSTARGDAVRVGSLRATGRSVNVYNLTVAGDHTYFVGRFGSWVHNSNPCPVKVGDPRANHKSGKSFERKVAKKFRDMGYYVRTNVYKWTPYGARFIDVEVWTFEKGVYKLLGGIEAKVGNSPYTFMQQVKDAYLKATHGYTVTELRAPHAPRRR
jgi:RHS repeat-associated protein